MSKRRWFAFAAVPVILALLLSACSGQQSKPAAQKPAENATPTPAPEQPKKLEPIKLKVGISGISINYAHFWVALNKGFFAEEGLDITTISFDGGPPTVQAMIAGEIPVSISSAIEAMACQLEGCDIKVVATFIPYSPYQLMTKPEIKTAADLKGKKVAVSKLGAESHNAAMNLVETLKMDPNKDVAYVAIGGQTKRLQALIAGSVDAAVISPPGSYQLKVDGYNVIADLIDARRETAHENVLSTDRFMKENPEAIRRFVRGFARGIHFFITNGPETQKIIADYLKMDPVKEKAVLETTWKEYAEKNTPKLPLPSIAGIKTQLPELAELKKDPKAANEKPERFVNSTFVQELETSGFMKKLWGN